MKTFKQKVVQSLLEDYSYIDESGELVADPKYGANHKIRIGSTVTTLRRWSYFAHYGEFPEHRLQTFSRNKQSLEPTSFYSPAEI